MIEWFYTPYLPCVVYALAGLGIVLGLLAVGALIIAAYVSRTD